MLKKSIGFNWGPCAVSTSYWTGVRLRDLLLHVGAKVRLLSVLARGPCRNWCRLPLLSPPGILRSACLFPPAHHQDPTCVLYSQGPAHGGNFVCFRGPKGELPKGDDGSYGTSLTWAKAMDPASDVIIAYKQVGVCAYLRGWRVAG